MGRTKDFNQDEVLLKAVYLFWNKGFNGTSMQDLVDGLGISRSSLYDTYGDKYQLYIKALESYKNTYGNTLSNLNTESLTAKAAVAQLLATATSNPSVECQPKGCFIVNAGTELASHDAEVNKLVIQTGKQVEEAFFKVILKGQAEGEISKDKDARTLASFFNNTVRGLQVSSRSTDLGDLSKHIIDTAVRVLD